MLRLILRTNPRQQPGNVESGVYLPYSCPYSTLLSKFCVNSRVLTRFPGKPRVAVALKTMVAELVASSSIPVSEGIVREVIDVLSGCVPWFCKVIKISEQGCMSSRGSIKAKETDVKAMFRGKENGLGKQVEGLLIFAKREGGTLIGREEVLEEFRLKRKEWEKGAIRS